MNSVSTSFLIFIISIFLKMKNGVGFDDFHTDVIRILDEIRGEDSFIPDDKTWAEICEKPPEIVDLCEAHPFERMEACLRIAQRFKAAVGGFDFNFRYIASETKCEEQSITGLEHSLRPMYLCPNVNIQKEDGNTVRLPVFYVFQNCYGNKLYVLKWTGEYKTAALIGEWAEFEVKRWPPETPQPPKSKWLLYTYDLYTASLSPDTIIQITEMMYPK